MLVQLAAQFFVLVALKLFSTVLIIILKFSIIKKGYHWISQESTIIY